MRLCYPGMVKNRRKLNPINARSHLSLRVNGRMVETVAFDDELTKYGTFDKKTEIEVRRRAKCLRRAAKTFGWSDERLVLFKKAVVEHRQNPTIVNYLFLRRQFPEVQVESPLFEEADEFRGYAEIYNKHGIDPLLAIMAIDGDESSIDGLCLHVMDCLVRRDKILVGEPGYIQKRREMISDSEVNYLIALIFDAFNDRKIRMPASFIVLLRHQLSVSAPDIRKEFLSKRKRQNAVQVIAQLLQPNESLSVRKLSFLAGIPRSTAARWLANNEFKAALKAWRAYFSKG